MKELIPIVAIVMPLGIVATVLTTKRLAESRRMRHQERMRAMEMGLSPYSAGNGWKALTCAAIGAGVPIACFFFAWLDAVTTHRRADEAWFGATVLSVIAVVSGGRLARTLFQGPAHVPAPQPNANAAAYHQAHHGKPAFDPDSYDVVGARG